MSSGLRSVNGTRGLLPPETAVSKAAAVRVGEEEVAHGACSLRDRESGEQQKPAVDDLVPRLEGRR